MKRTEWECGGTCLSDRGTGGGRGAGKLSRSSSSSADLRGGSPTRRPSPPRRWRPTPRPRWLRARWPVPSPGRTRTRRAKWSLRPPRESARAPVIFRLWVVFLRRFYCVRTRSPRHVLRESCVSFVCVRGRGGRQGREQRGGGSAAVSAAAPEACPQARRRRTVCARAGPKGGGAKEGNRAACAHGSARVGTRRPAALLEGARGAPRRTFRFRPLPDAAAAGVCAGS